MVSVLAFTSLHLPRRLFHFVHSQVHLSPPGLNQRQRWSKKFPLCLVVDPSHQFEDGAAVDDRPVVFYLFAATGRAKQEWHSRLRLASDPSLAASDLASVPRTHGPYARYIGCGHCCVHVPELFMSSHIVFLKKKANK